MARNLTSLQKANKKTDLKTSFKALKYIPRFFKEIWLINPGMFLANGSLRLINAFAPVIILWVGKIIIDLIIDQTKLTAAEQDYSQIWKFVAIELGIFIVSDVINRLITLTDGLMGDLYSNSSSVTIINKTKELGIAQLEDPDFYDKLERARTQTNSRVNLLSNSLSQVQSVISIITLMAGLIFFEPLLIILLVLSIIPSFINEVKFSNKSYSLARSWTAERRELDYLRYIGANSNTAKEIKLFGLTGFVADRFKTLSDKYYELNKNIVIKKTGYGIIFNILGVLSYYGAYVYIILRVLTGVLTIGELTFLSGSFNRLRNNLQQFFSRFTRIAESALYLKDYFDFIDLKVPEHEGEYLPLPKEIQEGFFIKDLYFRYPGGEDDVLKGVNFRINAGEKMAFVGQNGAGKTTLIKLILRFYEPTSGEILLDGVNINQYDPLEYQAMFGVIFQDFFKYEFTLKENIAVGNIDELENQERIETAASLSLADEVVSAMPEGYEQQLGRRFVRGQELSGGQWQKVALARAYMKDANVLILDEPTSALDAKAEFDVFERFINLTTGKTSIIISHRFSTVRMADRIIVIEDGKISSIGTHEELMQDEGLYAELFELQAAGYQ
ncbi:ABC transporter ATP-binding protein [Portibacter marinus]|uniref:ABC transporter ATP-binding protein n=1 Tax=Portibacter marinus TaxID=2898660 RepID=UPI001F1B1FCA|nr:ABC transporter ATP-binding protein [Portibacter marinus]